MDPVLRAQMEVLRIADRFFESSVLCALARLRVFEALGDGAATPAGLAATLALDPPTLERVLRSACALGLLEVDDEGRFAVTRLFRPVLADPSGPGYVGNWLRYVHECQRAVLALPDVVADPGLRARSSNGPWRDPRAARLATLAMHDTASVRARALVERLDLGGVRTILDVGCGPGSSAYALAAGDPAIAITLVDRAEVLEVAREIAAALAVANPITFAAADLRGDPLPAGPFDLVLFSNVLMALGRADARALLGAARERLRPGGRVVVQSPFPSGEHGRSRWPAIVDLLLLCTTADGAIHSIEETEAWLREAGFEAVERIALGSLAASDAVVGRAERSS